MGSRYFLGNDEYEDSDGEYDEEFQEEDSHFLNFNFQILNHNLDIFPYGENHSAEMIDLILKFVDEDAIDWNELYEFVIKEKKYKLINTLLKRDFDVDNLMNYSLEKYFFRDISKYFRSYNPAVKYFIKGYIDDYIHDLEKDMKKYECYICEKYGICHRCNNAIWKNKLKMINFELIFDARLIKTNEDFNEILLFTVEKGKYEMFKYMMFRKDNFIVDFDKILEIKNSLKSHGDSKINKLLEINMKYWTKY